jgi:hypothetical protein
MKYGGVEVFLGIGIERENFAGYASRGTWFGLAAAITTIGFGANVFWLQCICLREKMKIHERFLILHMAYVLGSSSGFRYDDYCEEVNIMFAFGLLVVYFRPLSAAGGWLLIALS